METKQQQPLLRLPLLVKIVFLLGAGGTDGDVASVQVFAEIVQSHVTFVKRI